MRAWVVVLLAAPALVAILGLAAQWTLHDPWLAEVPRRLGGTVVLVTAVMGIAAALCGVVLLVRYRRGEPPFRRTAIWISSLAGALYGAALLALQYGTKEGLF